MSYEHLLKETAVRRIVLAQDHHITDGAIEALDDHLREVLDEAIANAGVDYKRVKDFDVFRAVRKK